MKKIIAKRLQEGDVVVSNNGAWCPVVSVERVTNRRVTPHEEMVEVTYLGGKEGNVLFGALFALNFPVQVADMEEIEEEQDAAVHGV